MQINFHHSKFAQGYGGCISESQSLMKMSIFNSIRKECILRHCKKQAIIFQNWAGTGLQPQQHSTVQTQCWQVMTS